MVIERETGGDATGEKCALVHTWHAARPPQPPLAKGGSDLWKRVVSIAVLFAGLPSLPAVAADEAEFGTLEKSYTAEIRPLVVKYCQQCHSSRQAEADLNLASFPTLADVRKHPQVWIKVREMLETGQMPP